MVSRGRGVYPIGGMTLRVYHRGEDSLWGEIREREVMLGLFGDRVFL